ncbi:hypothetical protein SAMN05443665_102517 [Actinomadura meyerae]|uniref:Uncharacterized protein n=1 Tax=Actinomadura meyerae TaxID=240840 RepID=A0A239M168_9ACTN|nr:hypothetical protein [Actinomadura meyerae]SNT35714.1 hypothetical protein SAMN05443665_102517 [Actinomadura meyerae]
MNRSAKGLLGAAVVAPFAAVLAVAAAPANAHTAAEAAPGPSTALLYDAAAAAHPVTRALPDTAVRTGGQAAEGATGTVDGALRDAPGAFRAAPAAARCKLKPGKTVNDKAGTKLPETSLPVAGQSLGLPRGDCLGAVRRTAAAPAESGGPGGGGLLGDIGDTLAGGTRGTLPDTTLPGARAAGAPVSMAAPGGLDDTVPLDVPNVPAELAAARPAGLPVGSLLFPPRYRYAAPVPSDVVGQAGDTVGEAGAKLDRPRQNVGSVLNVLKAEDAGARRAGGPGPRPASGPLENGPDADPVSMLLGGLTQSGLPVGAPGLPIG